MNITRRSALRAFLFLASASFVSNQKRLKAQEEVDRSKIGKSVLIIGAGMAGIAAALDLQNSGYQVTILEGRERPGGRIQTQQFGDVAVDLGAAWIHGDSPSNPIMKLAAKYSLETSPTKWDETWFYRQGEGVIEDSDYNRIEELAAQVIEQVHALQESADETDSMERAVNALIANLNDSQVIKDGVRWWLSSEIEAVSAADYRDLSLKHWDEDEEFPGDDLLLGEGYGNLIAEMSKGINIKFNQTVTRINYSVSGVTVSGPWGELEADKAIVTVPLGVLQQNSIQFNPPLPESKKESISKLQMGVLNKIVLTFNKAIWPKEAHRLGLLAARSDERIEYFPLPPGGQSPILVGLAYGDHARDLEKLNKQQIINKVIQQLQKMFSDISTSDVVDVEITRWDSDSMTRGSYSHIPPDASLSDCETLGKPVGNSLFFAGEATHPLYLGTVHGAYLSGMRAAREIEQSSSAS